MIACKADGCAQPRYQRSNTKFCREHYNEDARRRHDPDRTWRRKLLYTYGITATEWQAMCDEQGGVCAICGNAETRCHGDGRVRRLAVDHDHETGKVRALLCCDCNNMIGDAHDDPERLTKAIDYLRRVA